MIEALILSYNALPMDVVASYRAKAYCDHLLSFGIRPTLLTHRWEQVNGDFVRHHPGDDVVVEEMPHCTVIRLPYPGASLSPSPIQTFLWALAGHVDVGVRKSYFVFKEFLWSHLAKKRYGVVIAIFNPHFDLRLAFEIRKEFGIPYVLDFRDLWDNSIVTDSYNPGVKKRILDGITSYWWRRWIHNSLFFATTGNKWRDFLSRLGRREGIVVRNGFEWVESNSMPLIKPHNRKFKVLHFGRMYKDQNLDIFLSGFRMFASRYSSEDVSVEIVGLKRIPEVDYCKKIADSLGAYAREIPYLPRQELLRYCASHAVLFFFPNFREDNGSFAVKVYDYVALKRNVIVCPTGGEVTEFVRKLNAGIAVDTPEEVAEYLESTYREFVRTGSVPFLVNERDLVPYTRREQVRHMAEKVSSLLTEES